MTKGDIGLRQAVDDSLIGRETALGGGESPLRFKTFLFIKIEA